MIANTSRLSTFAFIALFCGCNSHTSKDDVAAEVVAEVPQIEHPESNPINVGDSFTSSDRILLRSVQSIVADFRIMDQINPLGCFPDTG